MENYILKLNSGTEYKLYKGTTLVSDADLTTLFGTAGEMYLSFDFNSGTPSDLTTLTITDSSDVAVISNSNLTDTIAEGKNYKATWSNSATTFDTFTELEGKALDESQLSFLMGKIKDAGEGKIEEVVFDTTEFHDLSSPTDYPNGLYKIKYTGSGYTTIGLNTATNNRGIQIASGTSTLVILGGSVANSRTMVGFKMRHDQQPMLYTIYGNQANPVAYHVAGVTDLLNSTTDGIALSASAGRTLNNNIGTLSSLTTTDKTSAVAAINEVNAKGVYSTTEQVVGTWIDGKPLYRKIYETGELTSSEAIVDTISGINVKKLSAMLVNSNGAVQVYGAYREDNAAATSRVLYDGTYVKVQQGTVWQNSGYHALVEIQYTKTADT